jgi:hypothetical protein
MRSYDSLKAFGVLALASYLGLAVGAADHAGVEMHRTKKFEGPKANTGMAIHTREGKKDLLVLTDDFKVPDTPAPHWQVVDAKGNVYLLQRLVIKGDKFNKTIAVPAYVRDIAKVQIWCAWAETLLGEAAFQAPIKLGASEK